MVSRKRARSEVDAAPEQPPEEPGLLQQLRNCWEFANLMQYIAIFGKLMKIDEDFGIEDLENECLKPTSSEKLLDIGLCLLKWVSSHRGLTFDNFDEYTRRQYNAKAPHIPNPFGYEEVPNRFLDFDVFLKLRVLHQLSIWTFWNPDRIREKMPEQRELDQTQWRIEEVGYDREGRYYYILDDNRLYRRTDPPIPPPKPAKSKSRRKSARAMRASKRRKVTGADPIEESDEESNVVNGDATDPYEAMSWECIAVTLSDYQQFLESIRKTRDPDEKILRDRIDEQVMPIIEKEEESQQRQKQKREKELLNMQMLAGAKRSSRLAGKAEKERQEREAAEATRKRETELAAALKEDERVKKIEAERRSRIMTREQRIKDRERKRILHENELQRIQEEQEKVARGESRASERHLQAEMEKYRKNLEDLSQEDQWIFDCSGCGVHGQNLDDGSHSVACENCNVWQHSKCLGIRKDEAEREDFHFVCEDCKRREEEAKMPKIPPLKFRVGSTSPSSTAVEGDTKIKGPDVDQPPTPSIKEAQHAFQMPSIGSPQKQLSSLPSTSQNPSQVVSFPPPSPERRPQSAHTTSCSSPRAPFSPSKGANGFTPSSKEQLPKLPSMHQAMHLPPHGGDSFNSSFPARRPSSSHSVRSPTLPSPIQNRPSMSPTQGNRDVGPLAGFPPVAPSDHSAPWTPYGQQHTPRPNTGNHASFSSLHNGRPSFMATPTASRSSPPQSSHGIPFSGISPTKQSPRPVTSGSVTGAPVLPPIQKLEPSPKLMGRSSPDAPIPPPVKCMTPEQEERRQRENALLQAQLHGTNGQSSVMSSPSLNRIPPLGPPAVAQQPAPSPQPGPK
ncbi:hypothetical protein BO94DRAFT_553050 [Aspergillus sclerotioniger CBS 115572]|uniref:Zinc finger PHD-type domain-containing protein n=1 Tax=Aspergillus sclerotioniger CBS 115572 TaxID=1450535 RepID=A0A317XBV7_9EURO|nr:hypothetical protein BO94DRAFT_553050 [Aspergillus sclerotioniger CBS 115572]PWY95097.1 hypothetical protein BO94DRAFT_553050 [Aspergillus sclerotioniger CBS 115572]